MNKQGEEGLWPFAVFATLWWMIAKYTPFEDSAWLLALVLMAIAWISGKAFVSASYRLGDHAPVLLGRALFAAIAVIIICPRPWGFTLFWIWVLGPPLVIAAALARPRIERHKVWRERLHEFFSGLAVLFVMLSLATTDSIVRGGLLSAIVLSSLYFGWEFGAPRAPYAYDARMGDEQAFRDDGVMRDR